MGLTWDDNGKRLYETGIYSCALYPTVSTAEGKAFTGGVAWNGISSITETASGAEATAIYADNIKYLNLISAEEFGLTIEAYMYPDAWALCDGSIEISEGVYAGQQSRKQFGIAYKTLIGSDTEGNKKGYKLHLVWGATATPSEKNYTTVNDSPEAITFSWTVSTVPGNATLNDKTITTASIVIDSTKADPDALAALEAKLFTGSENYLPTLQEVISAFAA